jgi:uncharacterized membrane protein YcaP (DUF421 family)
MFDVDWGRLFVPSGSLVEIFLRGSVIYLILFVVMRFLPRREVGGLGAADILVIVLIADAVQEGMAGRYESITEGLLLAATIFLWATLIDWIDYRFPDLHLAEGRPLMVVRNGRLLRRNMHREQVTEDEVRAQMRQHGYERLEDVAAAYIEGDGQFSVLGRSGAPAQPPQGGKARGPQGH